MYFLKRAWLYVKRKWGKALTVGIILFIVSTLVLTGLLIRTASERTFDVARNKLGATVTYTTDLSSVTGSTRSEGRPETKGSWSSFSLPDDYEAITTKEIALIASQSKYVKSYTVAANLGAEAVDFSYYNPAGDTESDDSNDRGPGLNIRNNANINIIGIDTEEKETNFDNNTIIDGRYFTDEEVNNASNVIIIEKTIADLNNIAIGDNITIEKVASRRPGDEEEKETTSAEITYQVIAIYKTSNPTDLSQFNFMGTFNLTENEMYAPYTTVLASNLAGLESDELTSAQTEIKENGYEVQNVTFTLDDPSNIDNFIAEVKTMTDIDTTYRSLNANDAAYEQMVGPIENVAKTSTVLVIVVVIAGSFIIGLLSMLSIKDRKYELGVLLSLGEARFKIVAQLISEMIIIAVVSFGLASLVSNATAQVTTNFLLNQELSSTKENDNQRPFGTMPRGEDMFRPNTSSLTGIDVDTIDKLTITLNGYDVLKMFGISIIIIIVGNFIQAMFVLRCNPKEILLER